MKKYIFIILMSLTSCSLFQNGIIPFHVKEINIDSIMLSDYEVTVYRIEAKKEITLQRLNNYPKPKSDRKKINWMLFNDYPKKHRIIEILTEYSHEGPAIVPYHGSKLVDQLTSSNHIFFSGYYNVLKFTGDSNSKYFPEMFFLNPNTNKLYKLVDISGPGW